MKTYPAYKELPCIITRDERLNFADEMAKATRDLAKTQAEKKDAAARYASREKTLNLRLGQISEVLISGEEVREVRCEWHVNYALAEKRLIRCDTWETLEVRPLSEREMQTRLEMDAAEDETGANTAELIGAEESPDAPQDTQTDEDDSDADTTELLAAELDAESHEDSEEENESESAADTAQLLGV